MSFCDTLLIGVKQHLLKGTTVLFDPEWKGIGPKEVSHLAAISWKPSERIALNRRIQEPL